MSPKRTAPSKYTADRQIPGAFEGETVSRRRFMGVSAQAAGAIAVSAFVLPSLGFALGPVFEKVNQPWQAVGLPSDFTDDTYVPKVITIVPDVGQVGKSTVYVRKRNPRIDTEE